MIAKDNTPRATDVQINFLEILFNDLGFDRVSRNAWLTEEAGREIHFLDELTIGEASRFIETLKDNKEAYGTIEADRARYRPPPTF